MDVSTEQVAHFLETFLYPEVARGGEDLVTFHAVFVAAVEQKYAVQLGAAPSKPWIHYLDLTKPPKKYTDLAKHPLRVQFIEAMQKEIQKLITKGTWRVLDRIKGRTTLPLKWVYTYKFDPDGYLKDCKARICV